MKKLVFVFFCILTIPVFAQENCCNRRGVEQYIIDVLEKEKNNFIISGSNDKVVLVGFFLRKGKVRHTAIFYLDSTGMLKENSLFVKDSERFSQYLVSELDDAKHTGWIIIPSLFKYTTSEEDPRTTLFSQDIFYSIMKGVSLLSIKFRGAVYLQPFVTFYGATYY